MDLDKLEKILGKEQGFRLKQIKKAVFRELIENWEEISTLPKNLRERLSEECPINELKKEKVLISKDKQTIKALFKLRDGCKIESVLMKHIGERITVCVSCQVGCSIGCEFCATGQQGFKRNLSSGEIVDQVLFFARTDRVTNVVFMGMGEPFLNYDNVLGAIRVLNDKDEFNLGARHISISTAGIIEGIKKFSEEKIQVNLAISFHAIAYKSREKVLAAVDNYIAKTNRKVMFEYLMIDGVNDSPKQAEELAKLMKKPLYFINLISFNPVGHSNFEPSSDSRIKKFREILEKNKIAFTQRHRFGQEIQAACGQLTYEIHPE